MSCTPSDNVEGLLKRIRIRNRMDPDYVPSDRLVHLIPAARADNSEAGSSSSTIAAVIAADLVVQPILLPIAAAVAS